MMLLTEESFYSIESEICDIFNIILYIKQKFVVCIYDLAEKNNSILITSI